MLTGLYVRLRVSALSEGGSVATEYALLVSFIAILLIGSMMALRGGIEPLFRAAVGPLAP